MSPVAECSVPECVFNRASRCYAQAITIGNGAQPECLTFHAVNYHVPKRDTPALVGACKVAECRHNRDYACGAPRIYVENGEPGVVCVSFTAE